jgi:hypothetical protein
MALAVANLGTIGASLTLLVVGGLDALVAHTTRITGITCLAQRRGLRAYEALATRFACAATIGNAANRVVCGARPNAGDLGALAAVARIGFQTTASRASCEVTLAGAGPGAIAVARRFTLVGRCST